MRTYLLIVLSTCQICQAFCQESDITYKASATSLLATALEEKAFVGVAAGFAVNGEIMWEDGLGYRNSKSKAPFTDSTLTRIASITKPMTAIAIMQLYEQEKLDLDQPIQKYLPAFPVKKKGAITIRHLLTHTSGIAGYKSNKEAANKKNYPTLTEASTIFKDRELLSIPGEAYNYSTYGYVVLGMIIEAVSGMSYDAYLKKNIWDKAGMTHTGIEYFGETYPNQSALYHKKRNGKTTSAKPTNLSDRLPGGGLYSCVTDILKFGDALLDNRLVEARTLQAMIADPGIRKEGSGYGFGWYLYGENAKYGNVYGHTGAQIGCSAMLMLLPEQKTSIVVLSNTSGALQSVSNIAVRLFDIAAMANQKE